MDGSEVVLVPADLGAQAVRRLYPDSTVSPEVVERIVRAMQAMGDERRVVVGGGSTPVIEPRVKGWLQKNRRLVMAVLVAMFVVLAAIGQVGR